jgi:hypothetical protein
MDTSMDACVHGLGRADFVLDGDSEGKAMFCLPSSVRRQPGREGGHGHRRGLMDTESVSMRG